MLNKPKTTLIQGPVGKLEIMLEAVDDKAAPIAVICHPHPVHGGTMFNKVVSTIHRAFAHNAVSTIRFNFRGVGESCGSFDQGIGELDDLLAVVNWAGENYTGSLFLAGFSFGGWIALKGALQLRNDVKLLVQVSPQVSRFKDLDVSALQGLPWVFVQGEQDEVISADEAYAWIDSLNYPPELIRMDAAGHFFHGQLLVLREALQNNISEKLNDK